MAIVLCTSLAPVIDIMNPAINPKADTNGEERC